MTVHYITSTPQVLQLLNSLKKGQTCVITDHHCLEHCVAALFDHPEGFDPKIFTFPAGEINKTLDTFSEAIDFLAQNNLSRQDQIINIGGGVTTDLGGFVAACYKRSIPFINVPTSLLAMVDAAHGGKVGVNHGKLKNYIGSFTTPSHTIICPEFLNTLPKEHLLSGFAEMLKHGIISSSRYWDTLKSSSIENLSPSNWMNLIEESIRIKTEIVQNDPLEKGERKKLNYGHTVGHAIESHLLHSASPVHHGTAVAAGMIIEAHIAMSAAGLNKQSVEDITNQIIDLYGQVPLEHGDFGALIELMQADKKNHSDSFRMALPKKIGVCDYDVQVNAELINRALLYYINL